jgi:hypothetical protein
MGWNWKKFFAELLKIQTGSPDWTEREKKEEEKKKAEEERKKEKK